MKKYILTYGLLAGGGSISLALLNWLTVARLPDPLLSQVLGYLAIVVSLMCIPFGIRHFRDRLNGGQLKLVEGVRVGIGITSVTSVVVFAYVAGFSWLQGLAPSPWFLGLFMFLTTFAIGAAITGVSSILLRRRQEP